MIQPSKTMFAVCLPSVYLFCIKFSLEQFTVKTSRRSRYRREGGGGKQSKGAE